jgi:hypothetical protein
MLPCLNKELLGVECPGCGLQRSALLLIHGEFWEAFVMYPAIYSLLLLLAFLGADYFLNFKNANKISIVLMLSTVFLILANYILKLL